MSLGNQTAPRSILASGTSFREDLVMKMFLLPFFLFRWFKKSIFQLFAKGLALRTGNLPRGSLPRNSVDRITDRPDMTSAVDLWCKALAQQQQQQQQHKTDTFLSTNDQIYSFNLDALHLRPPFWIKLRLCGRLNTTMWPDVIYSLCKEMRRGPRGYIIYMMGLRPRQGNLRHISSLFPRTLYILSILLVSC